MSARAGRPVRPLLYWAPRAAAREAREREQLEYKHGTNEAGRRHRSWHGVPVSLRGRGDVAAASRQRVGGARVENFDVSDLPCKIAAQVPRGGAPDALQSRRLDGAQGTAPRRRLHHLRHERRDSGAARRKLEPQVLRGGDRDRGPVRLGNWRPRRHLRRLRHLARKGTAPHLAVLHSRAGSSIC